MTETISEHTARAEVETMAEEIFEDFKSGDISEDELSDRAHESVDGHSWVIYYYSAHRFCLECDTTDGEAFLEDVGMPENPTYDSLAAAIVYGELVARLNQRLEEMVEECEE